MQALFSSCVLICLVGCTVARAPDGTKSKLANGILEEFPKFEKDNSIEVAHDDFSTAAEVASVTPGVVFYEPPVNATVADFDIDGYLTELDDEEDVDVDENGCHVRQKNELEAQCFESFQGVISESVHMPDNEENEKTVCCALEEYEKCSVRGYFSTHCDGDKEALKETLKAARIFLGALTRISCSGHRGRCAHTSSALSNTQSALTMLMIALVVIVPKRV